MSAHVGYDSRHWHESSLAHFHKGGAEVSTLLGHDADQLAIRNRVADAGLLARVLIIPLRIGFQSVHLAKA